MKKEALEEMDILNTVLKKKSNINQVPLQKEPPTQKLVNSPYNELLENKPRMPFK